MDGLSELRTTSWTLTQVGFEGCRPSASSSFQMPQSQPEMPSQPAQVPVAKTSPSISSGLSSFGDRPPTSPQPNFQGTLEQPPGLQQSPQRLISEVRQGQGTAQNTQGEASSQDDRDVFTKSEKWLPPLPKCEHGTWKTREQEILGFAGYVQSLRSWVALASDTFGWELESALSWPHELHMTNLKPAQQLRSARSGVCRVSTRYGWFFSGSARNVWF